MFWFTSLALTQMTIWVDGVDYLPAWIGFALNVVASWITCRLVLRSWTWFVPALWWTFATVVYLDGDWLRDWQPALWAVGVILYIGQVGAEGSERRKRRRLAQAAS